MIHLDTNILVDLVTVGSPQVALIREWLTVGETLAVSSIAWSGFCSGPHTRKQKDAVHAILVGGVIAFSEEHAEHAARLFHYTGRKRGSHAYCMIAAAALCSRVPVATRNIRDFEKFIPHWLKLEAVPTH
jgi:predicted nucleic acid-binding protein